MKRFLRVAALIVATLLSYVAEVDAGVAISIGQPGFYGRLNMGGFPPPRVYYRQPKIIRYIPNNRPPIYLRVRPGHARQWARYCNYYNACYERVYFVRHDWYHHEYAPRYQKFYRGNYDGEGPGRGYNDHDNRHDHNHR